MADPFQLSCSQEDLPTVLVDRSPGAPGDDGHDDLQELQLTPPRAARATSPANHHERPASPRAASVPAFVRRRERRLQETLENIGLLHTLPRLQEGQLPADLWTSMVALVPPGEEESFLFRYLFLTKLPSRLRSFARGLVNHSNWLMAEVTDYLWRSWLSGDPQGVPYLHPRVAAVGPAAPRRGGRSLRRPHIGRAPSASAGPRDHSSPPRGCLCYDCRGTSLLL